MDFFLNPYSIDTGDKVPAKVDYSTAISKTLIKQLQNYDPFNKLQSTQIFILTATNDELRNVLHQACQDGDTDLFNFLIDKSISFNVQSATINQRDFMGQTPLYLLCEKGFRMKNEKRSRKEILERLIQEKAEWTFVCPSICYTPLHWLGYWNDISSIHLLFETFD